MNKVLRYYILLIGLLLIDFCADAQYTGGSGDGYAKSPVDFSITTDLVSSFSTCEGGSVNFEIIVNSGLYPVAYQWYYSSDNISFSAITSAIGNKLDITNADSSDEGYYFCEVNLFGNTKKSSTTQLSVVSLPSLTITESNNAGICLGDDITLTANDGWGSYQWFVESTKQDNDTSKVFTHTPERTTKYLVEATLAGCKISAEKSITVIDPKIDLGPDRYIGIGGEVTLKALVDADWTSSDNSFTSSNVQSVTVSPNLTTTYTASSAAGCSASDDVTVFVRTLGYEGGSGDGYAKSCSPICIIIQPEAIRACQTSANSMFVVVQGTKPEYLWKKYNISTLRYETVNAASHISGITESKLIFDGLKPEDEGEYLCEISNDCSTEQSDPVNVNVIRTPIISADLQDQSPCLFSSGVTLSIGFDGDDAEDVDKYTWTKNGNAYTAPGNNGFVNFSSIQLSDQGVYTVKAENDCGADVSTATLTVLQPPMGFEQNPENLKLCFGESGVMAVEAQGGGSYTYEWLKVSGLNYVNEESLPAPNNESTYTFTNVDYDNNGYYRCKISNVCGPAKSSVAKLDVFKAPQLLNIYINDVAVGTGMLTTDVCEGKRLSMKLGLSVSSGLLYTWRRDGNIIMNSGNISISDGVLTINSVTSNDAGYYTCEVDNQVCGKVKFQVALFSTNPQAEVISITQNDKVCVDDSFTFKVKAENAVDYTWKKGQNILSNTDSYVLGNATPADGGIYTCVVGNNCGEVTRNVNLEISTKPTFTQDLNDEEFCLGSEVNLNVQAAGTDPIRYIWKRNGVAIQNAITNFLNLGEARVGIEGKYECHISNVCDDIDSDAVSNVSIAPSPQIFELKGGGDFCQTQPGVEIYIDNTLTTDKYALYRMGETQPIAIKQGNGNRLSFGLFDVSGVYNAMAIDDNGCMIEMDNLVDVVEHAMPDDLTAVVTKEFCANNSGATITLSGSQPSMVYQLYKEVTTGDEPIGLVINGDTDNDLEWENLPVGNYYLFAENDLGCGERIGTTIKVEKRSLPQIYQFSSNNPSYCSNGVGAELKLADSDVGARYQLFRNGNPEGSEIDGTDEVLKWTDKKAGTYTMRAINQYQCAVSQNGTVSVVMKNAPTQFNLTGGGVYCPSVNPVDVMLLSSEIGLDYVLSNESDPDFTPVTVPGTGAALNFGEQQDGVYKVTATNTANSCSSEMNKTVEIKPFDLEISGNRILYIQSGDKAQFDIELVDASTNPNYSYSWEPILKFETPTDKDAKTKALTSSEPNITLKITDIATGCETPEKYFGVGISSSDPLVVSPISGITSSICPGEIETYLVSVTGGSGVYTYEWSFNGTTYSTHNNQLELKVETPGDLSVKVDDGFQLPVTVTTPLDLIENPTVYNLIGEDICYGNTEALVLSGYQSGLSYVLRRNGTIFRELNSDDNPAPVEMSNGKIEWGDFTSVGEYRADVQIDANSKHCYFPMNNMVHIDPIPIIYSVTGGGEYCEGGISDVHVGLDGSENGVTYKLFRDNVELNKTYSIVNDKVDFGVISENGIYTIKAFSPNSNCEQAMSGFVEVKVNAIPKDFTVDYDGVACANGGGVTVSVTKGQDNVNYRFYTSNGSISTLLETEQWNDALHNDQNPIVYNAVNLPNQYYVVATNASFCVLKKDAVRIDEIKNVNWLVQSNVCEGIGAKVWLDESQANVTYYLESSQTGRVVGQVDGLGNNDDLEFPGTYSAGSYRIRAVSKSQCEAYLSQTRTIYEVKRPTTYNFTVQQNEDNCENGAGLSLILEGSEVDVDYTLYKNGADFGEQLITGTGSSIDFGIFSTSGNYSVFADNNGCTNTFASKIIHSLPASKTLVGNMYYCKDENGTSLSIGNSEIGVTYELYSKNQSGNFLGTGKIKVGNGGSIYFHNIIKGTYKLYGKKNGTECGQFVSSEIDVEEKEVNDLASLNTTLSKCISPGAGTIELNSTDADFTYELQLNGVATIITGTINGLDITWMNLPEGEYRIKVSDPATGCSTFNHDVELTNVPEQFTVTSANYCEGSPLSADLANSTRGVTYTLLDDNSAVMTSLTSQGGAISLTADAATYTAPYTVVAVNSSSCSSSMANAISPTELTLPAQHKVTGGYDNENGSLTIGLDGADNGITYALYCSDNPTQVLEQRSNISGSFTFSGSYSTVGVYTVTASNGDCAETMSGNAEICKIYALNKVNNYCSGDPTGINLVLDDSQFGVKYKLYKDGSFVVGSETIGTGGAITWGGNTDGAYTVKAVKGDPPNEIEVTVGTYTISPYSIPLDFTMTGDVVCPGSSAEIKITPDPNDTNLSFSLFYDGEKIQDATIENGLPTFSNLVDAGDYTVRATNSDGCIRENVQTIEQKTTPNAYSISGTSTCKSNSTDRVSIGLVDSEADLTYTLFCGVSPVETFRGNGNPFTFTDVSGVGVYTVTADYEGQCSTVMDGNIEVAEHSTQYNITGVLGNNTGSNFTICEEDEGVEIKLSGSETNMIYGLIRTDDLGNTEIMTTGQGDGTGAGFSFGFFNKPGRYTVKTNNVCEDVMNGEVVILVNSIPDETKVSFDGGGSYCNGDAGLELKLKTTEFDIDYSLYFDHPDNIVNNSPLDTKSSINGQEDYSFGTYSLNGVYYVKAVKQSNGCSKIFDETFTIGIDDLPNQQILMVENNGYLCDNNSSGLEVYLQDCEANVKYQLMLDGSPIGGLVSGTPGNKLSFGKKTDIGTYTVKATSDLPSSCERTLSSTVSIRQADLPTVLQLKAIDKTYYCRNSGGVGIEINGIEANVTYHLIKDGLDCNRNQNGSDGGDLTWTGLTGKNFYDRINDNDGFEYKVLAINDLSKCSSYTENSLFITEDETVLIESQPSILFSRCEGEDLDISVKAKGGHLNYKWYKGTGTTDIGSGQEFIRLLNITNSDATTYYCTIENSCSSVTSSSSKLEIVAPAEVTAINYQSTLCAGDKDVLLSIDWENAEYFQWTKDGAVIEGATQDYLLFDEVDTDDSGDYICAAGNRCPADYSNTASILVDSYVEVTDTDVVKVDTVCMGEQGFKLEIAAQGSNLVYQWYKEGNAIPGATQSEYEFTSPIQLSDAGNYSVVVTNSCDLNGTGRDFYLNVFDVPDITTPLEEVTKCVGDSHEFRVVASGGGLNYIWQKGVDSELAEESSSLSFAQLVKNDEAVYRCSVWNECGSDYSDAELKVNEVAVISGTLYNHSLCSGTFDIELSVGTTNADNTASSNNEIYEWRRNGESTKIRSGIVVNQSRLLIPNATHADEGHYTCNIDGVCVRDVSEISYFKINDAPSFVNPQIGLSISACEGASVDIKVEAKGGDIDYYWEKKQVDGSYSKVLNSDGFEPEYDAVLTQDFDRRLSLHFDAVSLTDAGVYRCVINNDCTASPVVGNDIEFVVGGVGAPTAINWPNKIVVGSNFSVVLSGVSDDVEYWIENDQEMELVAPVDGDQKNSDGKLVLTGSITDPLVTSVNLIVKARNQIITSACDVELERVDNILVTSFSGVYLEVQLILGGRYQYNSTTGEVMLPYGVLNNFPDISPFGADDQNGDGVPETTEQIPIDPSLNKAQQIPDVVDWIKLSLRSSKDVTNGQSAPNIVEKSCVLKTDGFLYPAEDLSNSVIAFSDENLTDVSNGYYVVVESRNHLDFITDQKLFLSSIGGRNATFIDFKNPATSYANCAKLNLGFNNWCGLVPGDINNDRKVNGDDFTGWYNDVNALNILGYWESDLNLDGRTNGDDFVDWYNSIGKRTIYQGF